MDIGSSSQPTGELSLIHHHHGESLAIVAPHPARELSLVEMLHYGCPQPDLHPLVNDWRKRNIRNLVRGMWRVLAARRLGIATQYGQLWLTHHSAQHGDLDLGLASLRVVTTAGVNYIVDAFQGTTEPENMKFHGIGTGTTAEATGDTALVTELTTQYQTDNVRPTGSQGEGATANVYRTSATITPDSGFPVAVTEHGIFSQAATGGGTLLDRSVFAVVTLASGDAITTQYDGTFAAGG